MPFGAGCGDTGEGSGDKWTDIIHPATRYVKEVVETYQKEMECKIKKLEGKLATANAELEKVKEENKILRGTIELAKPYAAT